MNQNMHNWIASALGVLTVQALVLWPKFKEVKTEHEFIIFFVQFISPFIFLGVWYCFIS
jgi:hypothetical protein